MSSHNPDEQAAPRFLVGIDLGTTNSALSFVDTEQEPNHIQSFSIPQETAPGTVEEHLTLPSFHFEPTAAESAHNPLPWAAPTPPHQVGILARDQGAAQPDRVVVSAKSWLSHAGVDRQANILPWHGAEEVPRHSPTVISSRYLAHLRAAWNHVHPDHPLEEQSITLTVPASFDEVARELTVEAARLAGLPRLHLIEEPQAAFYHWMHQHQNDAGQTMQPGDMILVCDIGGGTSDFTLIQVEADDGDTPTYRRVAVGEHLILGGDNLDLALAHHVEEQLDGASLNTADWGSLVRRCREAKEALLDEQAPEQWPITLASRGSGMVGGSRSATVLRSDVERLLTDGFLPSCALTDEPVPRASGFQEFGLPYAPDPAIPRYLAAFLRKHAHLDRTPDACVVRPDHILLNGGFFYSSRLRQRFLDTVTGWFSDSGKAIQVLPFDHLDRAVASGAAAFGRARLGQAHRIQGGLARAYYLGISRDEQDDGGAQALCLLPSGLEEGQQIDLDQAFSLRIREPVQFPIYTSSLRTLDQPGEVLAVDPESMRALPPVRTVVRSGKKQAADRVEVRLHARLTELGTIEVWFSERQGNRSWKLQFDIRAAVETERSATEDLAHHHGLVEEAQEQQSREVLAAAFAPGAASDPAKLILELEEAVGLPRDEWPPALLRSWWEQLLEYDAGRAKSPAHEARWLNLLGFCLRPGHGYPLDDWRVTRTRQWANAGILHAGNEMCRAEWWILWRRIAGGLNSGQQQALAAPLLKTLRQASSTGPAKKSRLDTFRFGDHETAEVYRVLGSLEGLPAKDKGDAANLLMQAMRRKGCGAWNGAGAWALGRMGARVPTYGPLNAVVPSERAAAWLTFLLEQAEGGKQAQLAVMLLARKTGDRYRDLPEETREQALRTLGQWKAPEHFIELIANGGALDEEEKGRTFGDSLPPGLHLAG